MPDHVLPSTPLPQGLPQPAPGDPPVAWALWGLSLYPNFRLFPILRNKKKPFFPWPGTASGDPDQIREWGERYPDCNFALDAGASGVSVIDVDVKNKGVGMATLWDLEQEHGKLPRTHCYRTPSGGLAIVFSGSCTNSVGKKTCGLGPNIDTRGVGGYQVFIGSLIDGKQYLPIDILPLAPVPAWVVELAKTVDASHIRELSATLSLELDYPESVAAAINYLQNAAPPAISVEEPGGGGGNDTTYKVACRARDYGVSQAALTEILWEHYNPRCRPPWCRAKIEEIAEHVCTYAQNKNPGVRSPLVQFDIEMDDDTPGVPAHEALKATPEKKKEDRTWVPLVEFDDLGTLETPVDGIKFKSAGDLDIDLIPPRDWIIKGRYVTGYITATMAPGGGSKSTLATLEAIEVATGRNLSGSEIVRTGPVLFYNAEDPASEIQRKIAAVCLHHEIPTSALADLHYLSGSDEAPLVFVAKRDHEICVNRKLVLAVKKMIEDMGVVLVVLDPYVRLHKVGENDNMEIDAVAGIFSRIAAQTRCAVHILQHTRKGNLEPGDQDAGRGAGSAAAATRVSHTLYVMSKDDAKVMGVDADDRRWFVRLDDAKMSHLPPNSATKWFKRTSVELPSGDSVGTLDPVKLEAAAEDRKNAPGVDEVRGVVVELMPEGGLMTVADVAKAACEDNDVIYRIGTNGSKKRTPKALQDKIRRMIAEDGSVFPFTSSAGIIYTFDSSQKPYTILGRDDM